MSPALHEFTFREVARIAVQGMPSAWVLFSPAKESPGVRRRSTQLAQVTAALVGILNISSTTTPLVRAKILGEVSISRSHRSSRSHRVCCCPGTLPARSRAWASMITSAIWVSLELAGSLDASICAIRSFPERGDTCEGLTKFQDSPLSRGICLVLHGVRLSHPACGIRLD